MTDPASGTPSAPIRLLTVDAHPLVRWALAELCHRERDLLPVADAADAAGALSLAEALAPDVVTIDTGLPDGTAWGLVRDLRARRPRIGLVVLCSGRDDDEAMLCALDCGASAFLSTAAPVTEVVAAIRHAAAAATSFSAAGLAQALRRRRDVEPALQLSPRELEVLALLRDGRSVPQVAGQLYISLSTAKTYVARVYEKLGAANRAQALMAAVRLGVLDAGAAQAAVQVAAAPGGGVPTALRAAG